MYASWKAAAAVLWGASFLDHATDANRAFYQFMEALIGRKVALDQLTADEVKTLAGDLDKHEDPRPAPERPGAESEG